MNTNNRNHPPNSSGSVSRKPDAALAAVISLRTGDLITRAWTILKKSLRQVVAITVFGMILPQLAFTWIIANKAEMAFEGLKSLTLAAKTDFTVPVFRAALDTTIRFISVYGAAAVLLLVVMLSAYSGIIQLSLDRLRRKRPRTTFDLMRLGFKATIARSLWATLLAGVLLGLTQVFPPIAVVVAVLATMIPVVAIAEKGGPLKVLWRAFTMRFAPKSRLGRWPVFFALLSLGGIFYLAEFALTMIVEYSNRLDGIFSLPQILSTHLIPGLPFTPIYLAADFVDTFVGISLLPILAAATSVLYMRVKKLTDANLGADNNHGANAAGDSAGSSSQ